MPLFRRPDGDPVRDAPPLRVLMPHLLRGRNESAVYFEQQLEVGHTLRWLEARNAGGGRRLTLFHVVLCALVRTLHARPQLHRFVVGRRLYQRRHVELSFAVKKALRDDAPLTTVKVRFEPGDGLDDVARRIDEAIGVGRGTRATRSEQEMALVTRLPAWLLALVLAAQRWLDACNLLPASLIDPDPLYASAFLANLGSIGLQAPYHHLFEYGTVPVFCVIGQVHAAPVVAADGSLQVRDVVHLRYTYDERIADGLYCARALDLLRGWVERPETLEATAAPAPPVAAAAAG